MAAPAPETMEVFAEAMESFRNSLTEKERACFPTYKNSQTMLQDLRDACLHHKETSRLYSCCRRIARFSKAVDPYFEVINIFVQVKPDVMGLIWGSIRLIFLLGSNHIVFLEKIASMFEELSITMPQYQDYYEICRKRVAAGVNQARVVTLLSYIYLDISTFCKDVHRLLSRQQAGFRWKRSLKLLKNTAWVPLDSRFDRLKATMRMHQTLFDQEMKLQNEAYLTKQFGEFHELLTSRNLSETEVKTEVSRQVALASERMMRIQSSICSNDWDSIYEAARRQRHPGSGAQFLQDPRFLNWRNKRLDSTSQWTEKLVSVQAKPGYGKTVLSTFIIDDLVTITGVDQLVTRTAFHHFSLSKQFGNTIPSEAFRSITAQLIHHNRSDETLIDSLSILFTESSSGQERPSEGVVDAVLKLLLSKCATFLVFDGVDECSDLASFFLRLDDIIADTDAKVILLSRPDIEFPRSYHRKTDNSWQLTLDNSTNREGIFSFLEKQLRDLRDDGLFGNCKVQEAVVSDLAQRANGMFLWARLLINYLDCEALTPIERLETLQEGNLLEGIDVLYNRILQILGKKYIKQKEVAADIFRWLSTSFYSINATELKIALAINPGKSMNELGMLANYPNCLPKITCALVEVTAGGSVDFIHQSLLEFLEKDPTCDPYFSLKNRRAMNLHLANVCISHLICDIPHRPLRLLEIDPALEVVDASCGYQARQENRPTPQELRSTLLWKYPLLRYAALCWTHHLIRGYGSESMAHRTVRHVEPQEPSQEIPSGQFRKRRPTEDYDGDHNYECYEQRLTPRSAHLQSGSARTDVQGEYPRKRQRFSGESEDQILTKDVDIHERRSNSQVQQPSQELWITLLSRFLLSRYSVTAWVEACWTFNLPPNLVKLQPIAEYLFSDRHLDLGSEREKVWTGIGLGQLRHALDELRSNDRLHKLLANNPTLIWQRHIVSATDPLYWPIWKIERPEALEEQQRVELVRAGHRPGDEVAPASSSGTGQTVPIVT